MRALSSRNGARRYAASVTLWAHNHATGADCSLAPLLQRGEGWGEGRFGCSTGLILDILDRESPSPQPSPLRGEGAARVSPSSRHRVGGGEAVEQRGAIEEALVQIYVLRRAPELVEVRPPDRGVLLLQ